MWPRTVTLYMSVPYAMADRVGASRGQIGHDARQRVEVAFAGNQRIELVVRKQRERELQPASNVPSRAARWGNASNLRRLHSESLRVKSRAEIHRDDPIAVPTGLD